jgi:hypothetical protein
MASQNEQQNVRKSRTTSSDRTDSTSSPPSAPQIVPPAVRPVPQNPDIAPDEPHEREVGIDSILQPTSLDLSLPEVRNPDVTRGSVLRGSANCGGGEQNKAKDDMDKLDEEKLPLRSCSALRSFSARRFAKEPYTRLQYVKEVETEQFPPAASTLDSQTDQRVVVTLPVSKVDV